MRKIPFIHATILMINTVNAQNDTIFYENRNIKGIGDKVNNYKVARWIFIYQSEQIESDSIFKEDKRHGVWKWYYENVQQMSLETCEDGEYEGGWFLDEKGSHLIINDILVRSQYPNGRIFGFLKFITSQLQYSP